MTYKFRYHRYRGYRYCIDGARMSFQSWHLARQNTPKDAQITAALLGLRWPPAPKLTFATTMRMC